MALTPGERALPSRVGLAGRIGIFGGSFDPVHRAHLELGRVALDHLALDELRFVPAGRAWQKGDAHAAAADRLEMLRLALDGMPRCVVDPCEIDRGGPSFTIDTVAAMQAARPGSEWFLVLGADSYAGLPGWHRWRELLPRVTWAVALRDGEASDLPPELAAAPHRTIRLPMPAMAISATEVRKRAAAGITFADLVPPPVARYIEQRGLYRPINETPGPERPTTRS